jgi:hypothetical protein
MALNRHPLRRQKARKCQVCKEPATQWSGVYAWCKPECGAVLARRAQAKQREAKERQAKAEHREQKRKVERLADLLARVQRDCNAYVRARDAGLPCISCGQHSTRMEAGHWKPVGRTSSPARFHPDNIQNQCHSCNVHGGGGLHPGYLPNLIARIGEDRARAVEKLHGSTVKWDRDALEQLAKWFRAETRRLKTATCASETD